MWELKESWLELVMRSSFLFVMVLLLLRLRNRGGGQISPLDQVVLFSIGDLIAGAAIKSDDSLLAALIAATTFVTLRESLNYLSFKNKSVSNVLEGTPKILAHNGNILWDNMRDERINEKELLEAVRQAGIVSLANVHAAILETNGQISVIEKK